VHYKILVRLYLFNIFFLRECQAFLSTGTDTEEFSLLKICLLLPVPYNLFVFAEPHKTSVIQSTVHNKVEQQHEPQQAAAASESRHLHHGEEGSPPRGSSNSSYHKGGTTWHPADLAGGSSSNSSGASHKQWEESSRELQHQNNPHHQVDSRFLVRIRETLLVRIRGYVLQKITDWMEG
jgi:hypothetical protein